MAGPFAAFITGKSGRIPQRRELTATLEDEIELAIPASEVMQSGAAASLIPRGDAPLAVPAATPEPAPAEEAETEPTKG